MSLMLTFARPPQSCPACGTPVNSATAVTAPALPKTGDVSICWQCAEVLEFADDGLLVLCVSEAKRRDPRVVAVRAALIVADLDGGS